MQRVFHALNGDTNSLKNTAVSVIPQHFCAGTEETLKGQPAGRTAKALSRSLWGKHDCRETNKLSEHLMDVCVCDMRPFITNEASLEFLG